jgi:hypothetical protein
MNGCGKTLKRLCVCDEQGLCVCREPAHKCQSDCALDLDSGAECGSLAPYPGTLYLCEECCVWGGVIW